MGIDSNTISILDAFIISLVGIAIVFAVLVILMLIIMCMGLISDKAPAFIKKLPKFKKKKIVKEDAKETSDPAPGSCGELVLVNTEERDAAMIMAIVADTLGSPVNELRFKSIRRVKEDALGREEQKA